MSPNFDDLLDRARAWAEHAVRERWLQARDIRELNALETASPGMLFEAGSHRPLVAAFFGGTGVGKSSLLNRLAGQPIARTGVERPTSREVSVYRHASIQIAQLPRDFPLDRVRSAPHHDDAMRQVLWIDMPDIDSVEQHNRELVLEWLPHIDVLVYVVSPERYRDDRGWRLLREHAGDHAWLFVLNQWDRGIEAQYDDFRRLLNTAGFDDPVVLRTDCRENAAERRPDDFPELQRLLRQVSERHLLGQLEARAQRARIASLREALQQTLARLGSAAGYRELDRAWERIWAAAQEDLMAGLAWPMRLTAAGFAGRDANPLARALVLSPALPEAENRPAPVQAPLWDDWAEGRVRDALSQLVVEAGRLGLPALPLKSVLDPVPAETGRQVLARGQLRLRQALALPGNRPQRVALRFMGLLAVILPLAALGWASYQVVTGYYESTTRHLDYLGTDFAIHSLLLIGLAWLLPWFACTRLRPSVENSALRGLREGVAAALAAQAEAVGQILAEADRHRADTLAEGERLLAALHSLTPAPAASEPVPALLRRMLLTQDGNPSARRAMSP
ncbi:hypothetical protein JCM19379_11790 [Methyloparacoccus murrellii]